MSTAMNASNPSHWRRYRTLYLLLLVCVAPVVASYTAYYALPPSGRNNYGDLIEPQSPTAQLVTSARHGRTATLADLRGQWVMLWVGTSPCNDACRKQLWLMRQVRATTGKDRDRIARVWLLTDGEPPEESLLRDFEGTLVLQATAPQLRATLPVASGGKVEDHLWLIDPLGNLMLRWPRDADPNRMKKDLSRLLRASQIG